MGWNIKGSYFGACSCNVGCPCALGEMEADQGWCSGGLIFDIKTGTVDDVDVSNTKVLFIGDWPKGFLQGDGTAKIYFDPAVSEKQRSVLESVINGKMGGVFEGVSSLISKILPSEEVSIEISSDDAQTQVTAGDFGKFFVKPLKGPTGKLTRLLHGAAAFRDDIILANGRGSFWKDPKMRTWESGGHGEQTEFDWSV